MSECLGVWQWRLWREGRMVWGTRDGSKHVRLLLYVTTTLRIRKIHFLRMVCKILAMVLHLLHEWRRPSGSIKWKLQKAKVAKSESYQPAESPRTESPEGLKISNFQILSLRALETPLKENSFGRASIKRYRAVAVFSGWFFVSTMPLWDRLSFCASEILG